MATFRDTSNLRDISGRTTSGVIRNQPRTDIDRTGRAFRGGSTTSTMRQDYYGDAMRSNAMMSSLGEMVSGIPVIGDILGPLFGFADKENAILQSEREMAFNAQQADLNRDWQREERIASQDWAYKMWQEQNEYNTLTARLARAKKAGVSPNALLGGEDFQAGSVGSASIPSGSQASFSSNLASSLLGQSAQMAKLRAEAANIESQTDNNKYELSWNKATQDERARAWSLGNSKTSVEIQEILSRSNLNDVEAQVSLGTLQIMQNKSETEISVMLEQMNLLRNESLDLLSQIEYRNGQLGLVHAQTDNYVAQTALLEQEQRLKQIEVAFSNATGLPIGTPEYLAVFRLWQQGELSGYVTAKTSSGMNQFVNGVADNLTPNIVVPFGVGSGKKPHPVGFPTGGNKTSPTGGKKSLRKIGSGLVKLGRLGLKALPALAPIGLMMGADAIMNDALDDLGVSGLERLYYQQNGVGSVASKYGNNGILYK